jgi:TusA-related sulfurtransferase
MAGTWPDPECHLDLTDLDPPEPMTRILAAAEKMEPGSVLFALLAREPIFLFPELQRRGHQWVGNFDETGSTYRIMIRVGALLE